MKLEHIGKRYLTKRGEVVALDDVSLEIEPGQVVALKGASGSGKTTLLLAAGTMLKPTEGIVTVDGQDVYALRGRERSLFRSKHIGFVFQMFHLIPYLNVLENVRLASGNSLELDECVEILEHFKLSDRMEHKPSELSAGARQRAAIARALIKKPKLVLADEPTGNLDPENAETVMAYLHEYAEGGGMVLVATHADIEDSYVTRTVYLEAGRMKAGAHHD